MNVSLRGKPGWFKVPAMLLRLRPTMILFLIVAGICGCDLPKTAEFDEQKSPHFIEGKERAKARDFKGAVEAFQHALDANPNSALAHFELGMLYENDEKNEWRYVLALYHYYRAQELRPNAYPADNARVRIQACRQELAKTESLAPLYPSMQRELEKLREDNSQLRRQVEFLQAQALARGSPGATNPAPGALAQTGHISDIAEIVRGGKPIQPVDRSPGTSVAGRKHTVKDRETFASIARLYRLRTESLLAANPSIEPKRLRAGQTVNIPGS
jgi:tetratricopeptide (TPR) repeat protein